MPREIRTWQRTEPQPGNQICPDCVGWGGKDMNVCHGFGAGEDWQNCWTCMGNGQIIDQLADALERKKNAMASG